jgi:hypothetical protein
VFRPAHCGSTHFLFFEKKHRLTGKKTGVTMKGASVLAVCFAIAVCAFADDGDVLATEDPEHDTIPDSEHSPAIKNLTKAEKKKLAKELKLILKELDTDGDGHLNLKEIKKHLNRVSW